MELISRSEYEQDANLEVPFESHLGFPMDQNLSRNHRTRLQVEILTGKLIE